MSEEQKNSEKKNDKPKSFVQAFMLQGGQNAALQWFVDNKTPISVFLITGVKFDGVISSFDQYTISIIDVKGNQQLIYKDKISTLTTRKAGGQNNAARSRQFNRGSRPADGGRSYDRKEPHDNREGGE